MRPGWQSRASVEQRPPHMFGRLVRRRKQRTAMTCPRPSEHHIALASSTVGVHILGRRGLRQREK
eukprot:2631797-Pyramimonas_sp.AAC.1